MLDLSYRGNENLALRNSDDSEDDLSILDLRNSSELYLEAHTLLLQLQCLYNELPHVLTDPIFLNIERLTLPQITSSTDYNLRSNTEHHSILHKIITILKPIVCLLQEGQKNMDGMLKVYADISAIIEKVNHELNKTNLKVGVPNRNPRSLALIDSFSQQAIKPSLKAQKLQEVLHDNDSKNISLLKLVLPEILGRLNVLVKSIAVMNQNIHSQVDALTGFGVLKLSTVEEILISAQLGLQISQQITAAIASEDSLNNKNEFEVQASQGEIQARIVYNRIISQLEDPDQRLQALHTCASNFLESGKSQKPMNISSIVASQVLHRAILTSCSNSNNGVDSLADKGDDLLVLFEDELATFSLDSVIEIPSVAIRTDFSLSDLQNSLIKASCTDQFINRAIDMYMRAGLTREVATLKIQKCMNIMRKNAKEEADRTIALLNARAHLIYGYADAFIKKAGEVRSLSERYSLQEVARHLLDPANLNIKPSYKKAEEIFVPHSTKSVLEFNFDNGKERMEIPFYDRYKGESKYIFVDRSDELRKMRSELKDDEQFNFQVSMGEDAARNVINAIPVQLKNSKEHLGFIISLAHNALVYADKATSPLAKITLVNLSQVLTLWLKNEKGQTLTPTQLFTLSDPKQSICTVSESREYDFKSLSDRTQLPELERRTSEFLPRVNHEIAILAFNAKTRLSASFERENLLFEERESQFQSFFSNVQKTASEMTVGIIGAVESNQTNDGITTHQKLIGIIYQAFFITCTSYESRLRNLYFVQQLAQHIGHPNIHFKINPKTAASTLSQ